MRIGHGYDSHRFGANRPLILGGVEIQSKRGGLEGHSDADAITHALIDAILGASGLGDIGRHFPPTDDEWKDADSLKLLARVVQLVAAENYQLVNADITVIAEEPKIGPHSEAISTKLAEILAVSPSVISIKGKSNEGLGWIGAGEGIAVHAVALLNRVEDQDKVHARYAPHLPAF